MMQGSLWLSLLATGALLTGCLGDRCGPGQVHEGWICRVVNEAGVAGDGGDARLREAGALDVVPLETRVPPTGLGDKCTDQPECAGKGANFCAVQPPATSGYCTVTGCTLAPDSCPAGYHCFDLGVFVPGAPKFCSED